MDTVHEENRTINFCFSPPLTPTDPNKECHQSLLVQHATQQQLHPPPPQIVLPMGSRRNSDHDSALSSRRPSAIIAALRRPSQSIALSAAHAVMNQRRYLLDLFHGQSDRSISGQDDLDPREKLNRKQGYDSLTIILSALYAKLLVVLGMAFPITEIISTDVQAFFYQGFYLYLYIGSILFVAYMYATLVREKAVVQILNSYHQNDKPDFVSEKKRHNPARYGSFYLRLGAIAFGIGSMVYSGLEFGLYFELKNHPECNSSILQAITPATRMLLTLVQVRFIFLNTKEIDMNRHTIIARFGLMHMIATNLCEWLYVLVEETKHEIIHLAALHPNSSMANSTGHHEEKQGPIMATLVSNASPFLFPCKIEYSLICAVILFEIWKKIKQPALDIKILNKDKTGRNKEEKPAASHFNFSPFGGAPVNSNHHFTVDCSNAHRGLFAGIMIIVLTIISLIMFFVLADVDNGGKMNKNMAEFEVSVVELILYIITIIAVIVAMVQMRVLKYDRKIKAEGQAGIGLDNTLLVVAQTGMFIYCMFSIIGCWFTNPSNPVTLLAEIFSFIQTSLQTMFVLDSWWRRCRTLEQTKRKPGRELITFLIIANMAMWTINTLEKSRAEFRPTHLQFFGDWAWTIITHISMPLAIFYRFHSTICLFEIWKSAYKIKSQYYKAPLIHFL